MCGPVRATADKEEEVGRKRRTRQPPGYRNKSPVKRPNSRSKELWQDPEFRARMMARIREQAEKRRADPDKKWSRRGVFDGHTRAQSEVIWATARARAERIVQIMIDENLVDIPATDDEKSNLALREAVAVILTPSNAATKLAACRLVLDFTRSKPTAKSEVTLKSTEDWLTELDSAPDAE